jgi:hypothetical protein
MMQSIDNEVTKKTFGLLRILFIYAHTLLCIHWLLILYECIQVRDYIQFTKNLTGVDLLEMVQKGHGMIGMFISVDWGLHS